MSIEDFTSPEATLSVQWLDRLNNAEDRIVECASDFAASLETTLRSAGYAPRRIDVGLRHLNASGVAFDVRGDVPQIAADDFESLAGTVLRAALARHRLSGRLQPRLIAHLAPRLPVARATSLGPVYALEPSHGVTPEPRRWPLRRIAVGVVVGLALGVLGLPRLGAPVAEAPQSASSPRAAVAPDASAPGTSGLATALRTTPPASPAFVDPLTTPSPRWPNDPSGSAWFGAGAFHLFAREPGRYVSVPVPLDGTVGDASLDAVFQKVGGPDGGGFGFIVRSATPTAPDPVGQTGYFVVAQITDAGDVGIWQRDGSRWLEVLPWTHTDAIATGTHMNAVNLVMRGTTLQLSVNGQPIANVEDPTMAPRGGVAIFVGGDLNEVAVRSLRVDALAP